jgi:hypothetical protein
MLLLGDDRKYQSLAPNWSAPFGATAVALLRAY